MIRLFPTCASLFVCFYLAIHTAIYTYIYLHSHSDITLFSRLLERNSSSQTTAGIRITETLLQKSLSKIIYIYIYIYIYI